jgi:hypothetical protein
VIVGPAAYAAYLGPVQAYEQHWVPNPGSVSLVSALSRLLVGYDTLQPDIPGWNLSGALSTAEAITGCVVAVVLFLLWRWYKPAKEETWLLGQSIFLTAALLAFPLSLPFGLIALLLVAANLILALRVLPRPPRWWYAGVVLSALPFTIVGWLPLAAAWLPTQRAQVLLDLPMAGLLALLGAQLYLLQRARKAEPLAAQEPEPLAVQEPEPPALVVQPFADRAPSGG